MSHDHSIDLTATIRELGPRSAANWHSFTKAGLVAGVAVGVLLVFMLVVFVIL